MHPKTTNQLSKRKQDYLLVPSGVVSGKKVVHLFGNKCTLKIILYFSYQIYRKENPNTLE